MKLQTPNLDARHGRDPTARPVRPLVDRGAWNVRSTLGRRASAARRGGFSFAEVLFAVVILGIGFILVAAIFPVAIQQTQATTEDAAAAAAARQAAQAIALVAGAYPNPQYQASPSPASSTLSPYVSVPDVRYARSLTMFPPTVKNYAVASGTAPPPAVVTAFSGPRWEAIRDRVISSTDPRYAYIPLYRRENNSPVMQLIVIAVTERNRTVYTDYQPGTGGYLSDTLPAPNSPGVNGNAAISPTVSRTGFGAGVISPDAVTVASTAPGEGWYMPTYSWNPTSSGANPTGTPGTGRSYRLGREILNSNPRQFELEAGDGLSIGPGPDGVWGTLDDITDLIPPATTFTPPSTANQSVVAPATLQPTPAYAQLFTANGSLNGRIMLSANMSYAAAAAFDNNAAPAAAVPGTYVVIADDYPYGASATVTPQAAANSLTYAIPGTTAGALGQLNGKVVRLGQPVPVDLAAKPPVYPGTFELDPAYPIPAAPTNPSLNGNYIVPIIPSGPMARVYLVGAGRTDATAYGSNPTGPAQDIGIYSGYVSVP